MLSAGALYLHDVWEDGNDLEGKGPGARRHQEAVLPLDERLCSGHSWSSCGSGGRSARRQLGAGGVREGAGPGRCPRAVANVAEHLTALDWRR